MNKSIHISYKLFLILSIIYLALPVVIFFLGYLKVFYGILFSVILITGIFLAIRDCTRDPDGKTLNPDSYSDFHLFFIVIVATFALAVTVINGVGEYVWGPFDHAYRRAIFNDLINYKWPIVYDPATQSNPEVIKVLNITNNQGFVYYFAYWLPSAIVGKLFGFAAGNITLVIWNGLGIFLTIIGMCKYIKKASYGTLFMFLCFSGLDVIPYLINMIHPYSAWGWLEGWVPYISFISNFNNLENVYHQAVPCYLIITLILLTKNNRSIGLIASLMFAYSPWATIGLVIPAVVRLLSGDLSASDRRKTVFNIFTFNNLAVPALMLFSFGTFYGAKSGALQMRGFLWEFLGNIPKFILVYVLLFIVEVLPALIFVVRKHRKDPMLWSAIAVLLICPFYFMSEGNNLVMRGSMPALFILCIFMAERIADFTTEDENNRSLGMKVGIKATLERAAFSFVIIGMSFVACFMFATIFSMTFFSEQRFTNSIVSFGNIAHNDYDFVKVSKDQFFVDSPEETFFFKYLAK